MRPRRQQGALRRFATAITVLTIVGHLFLGFEQSWATVLIALASCYGCEWLLETVRAASAGVRARYRGGFVAAVDFLLSAHITGLAVAMLLYPNERMGAVVFASAVAIGTKYLVRVGPPGRTRHVLNPSNAGIVATLLFFPWVGIAPPYMFTAHTSGPLDAAIPAIVVFTGSLLNAVYTRRVPLILAWLAAFALQAVGRAVVFGTPLLAGLAPMTGMAFLLFTFYMVTDPATTPVRPRAQAAFGAGVAAAYGVLMTLHVVFGLFFALAAVCVVRGVALAWATARSPVSVAEPAPLVVGEAETP